MSPRLGIPASSPAGASASVPPFPASFQSLLSSSPSPSPFPSAPLAQTSKDQIATNFGQSAQTYQDQAHLQRQCAHQLLSFLDKSCRRNGKELPDGPILEIGCGTGFITQRLIDRFLNDSMSAKQTPQQSLHITDLSVDMVQFCQHQVIHPPVLRPSGSPIPISFHVLDAETTTALPHTYSLIIGGFVAQWFKQLDQTVKQLLRQLKPGGRLLLSFPGHQSFPEWRERCDLLHLPYTAHPLPNPHRLIQQLQLSPHQYDLQVDMCPTYYGSAKAFFKSMKRIGAGGSDSGQSLSPRQMRRLLREWCWVPEADYTSVSNPRKTPHNAIEVHYEVVYLSILKDSDGTMA